MKLVSKVGMRFHDLTVMEIVGHKPVKYLCKCKCGGEIIATSGNLHSENTTSCGCARSGHIKDITGQRFDHLIPFNFAGIFGGIAHWMCRCDCGRRGCRNFVIMSVNSLQSHKTHQCFIRRDLTGKKFGRWTVLRKGRPGFWVCLCNCGNMGEVNTHKLVNKNSISCGCWYKDNAAKIALKRWVKALK
jgi:hypothetical protein